MVASISMSITDDVSSVDDSDLIVLGIHGPKKDDDDEEEETKDKDEEVPEPVLVGKAKDLDEEFGGALTNLMIENYKEFQHGAKANGATPLLTIVSSGGKVST